MSVSETIFLAYRWLKNQRRPYISGVWILPKWRINHAFNVYCISLCSIISPLAFGADSRCTALLRYSDGLTAIKEARSTKVDREIDIPPRARSQLNLGFCRVFASLSPTADSDIKIEIWLPLAADWNHSFEGIGNGGLGGNINYESMVSGLHRGFAMVATDTGHDDSLIPGLFAMGHPQKIADYGYRATHLAALVGKAIVARYYGNSPSYSYFVGCSQGGQEALMEAQRFPGDYNGVIAGDPDYNQTHHEIGAHLWISSVLSLTSKSKFTPEKALLISNAVNKECDSIDGAADGILEDPRKCKFNPELLQCKGPDSPDCLTASQVVAVNRLWNGPKELLGDDYYPGLERGGENSAWTGWIVSINSDANFHRDLGLPFFRYFVFNDKNWDFNDFNFKRDSLLVEKKLASQIDATDSNLRPLMKLGGKLIQYHGFSDADVAPRNSIKYYEHVVKSIGSKEQTSNFYRLFMVPGMGHCGGGPGANSFDMLTALQTWVERGMPPDRVIATKFVDDDPTKSAIRSHPLCSYPQTARYIGSGSLDDAANFHCRDPDEK